MYAEWMYTAHLSVRLMFSCMLLLMLLLLPLCGLSQSDWCTNTHRTLHSNASSSSSRYLQTKHKQACWWNEEQSARIVFGCLLRVSLAQDKCDMIFRMRERMSLHKQCAMCTMHVFWNGCVKHIQRHPQRVFSTKLFSVLATVGKPTVTYNLYELQCKNITKYQKSCFLII